jgi:hypothetical protein
LQLIVRVEKLGFSRRSAHLNFIHVGYQKVYCPTQKDVELLLWVLVRAVKYMKSIYNVDNLMDLLVDIPEDNIEPAKKKKRKEKFDAEGLQAVIDNMESIYGGGNANKLMDKNGIAE